MAHLEVEPKPSRPWWIWVLLAIVLVALAAILLNKCGTDQKSVARTDTINNVGAATGPDWKTVDFNSEKMTDADINDKNISVSGNANYTIYSLGENILFPTDGNEVSETGQAKLKMISDVIQKRFEGSTIGVFGSTDATGSKDYNKELGKERAESVKNWLTSAGNLASDHISVQSLGETEPVATNQTTAGRQQNRNVSIVVFPKQ